MPLLLQHHSIRSPLRATPPDPFKVSAKKVAKLTAGLAVMLGVGLSAPPPVFLGGITTFALATIVRYQSVWNVSPALHSPLMGIAASLVSVSSDLRSGLPFACS